MPLEGVNHLNFFEAKLNFGVLVCYLQVYELYGIYLNRKTTT